jgi:hypothetical protein
MTRPVQRFFDTTADPSKPYAFAALEKRGLKLVQVTIPAAQALTPNLPGLYAYAKWVPEPSRVQILVVGTGEVSPHGSADNLLATGEQERAMKMETAAALTGLLAGPVTAEEATLSSAFEYIYPDDDLRRIWKLRVEFARGTVQHFNVGLLLQERYRAGVGAPGVWKVIQGNDGDYSLIWVSAIGPALDWNDLPETPIPLRALYPDEELFYQFGGNVGVRKKSAAPATGSFSDADRALLQDAAADAKAARKRLEQMLGA